MKCDALVDLSLRTNVTAVTLDDALNDRQAYASAVEFIDRVQALKHAE